MILNSTAIGPRWGIKTIMSLAPNALPRRMHIAVQGGATPHCIARDGAMLMRGPRPGQPALQAAVAQADAARAALADQPGNLLVRPAEGDPQVGLLHTPD